MRSPGRISTFDVALRRRRSPWVVRLAASVFVAVALVAAVTVMTRDSNTWKSPSKETLGNTAASVQTARVAAETGADDTQVEAFARGAAGPAG